MKTNRNLGELCPKTNIHVGSNVCLFKAVVTSFMFGSSYVFWNFDIQIHMFFNSYDLAIISLPPQRERERQTDRQTDRQTTSLICILCYYLIFVFLSFFLDVQLDSGV